MAMEDRWASVHGPTGQPWDGPSRGTVPAASRQPTKEMASFVRLGGVPGGAYYEATQQDAIAIMDIIDCRFTESCSIYHELPTNEKALSIMLNRFPGNGCSRNSLCVMPYFHPLH